MLQLCFPVNNEVQPTFTPVLIPAKNTRELRNNVNPTSKKFNLLRFLDFLCSDKKSSKSGRKTIHHKPVHVGQRNLLHGHSWWIVIIFPDRLVNDKNIKINDVSNLFSANGIGSCSVLIFNNIAYN